MKQVLLAVMCLALNTWEASSQILDALVTNYYKNDSTFVMDGYTYQCDVDERCQFVTLYNKDNKWIYADNVYKATGKVFSPSIYEESSLNPIIDDDSMVTKAMNIVNNAFTQDMAKLFGTEVFGISMYLDSETGKVQDVEFNFVTFATYSKVPLSIYRDIELKLKEQISFVPTDLGKQLNYILLFWNQTPEGAIPLKDPD